MPVTVEDIRAGVRSLNLGGRAVCVHSLLKSFGVLDGGATAVIAGLLPEGCTILAPTFCDGAFGVPAPPEQRPARNGWDYETPGPAAGITRIYTPASRLIDAEMGAIPAALLARPGVVRGAHPLHPFAAVGPLADRLIEAQTADQIYAPLDALATLGGDVLLIGVDLRRLTLLHRAEQLAGRRLFLRWVNGTDGRPRMVEVGGCSKGFENLAGSISSVRRETIVGSSRWQSFSATRALTLASAAIQADPAITHCGDADCERCRDAVLGGPVVSD